jgi:hypothetical protein
MHHYHDATVMRFIHPLVKLKKIISEHNNYVFCGVSEFSCISAKLIKPGSHIKDPPTPQLRRK